MVQKYLREFTTAERTEMRDRWQRGESLRAIWAGVWQSKTPIHVLYALRSGRKRSKLFRQILTQAVSKRDLC